MFFKEGFGFDNHKHNEVKNNELYETLGVSKKSTPSEIKRAYYKLAREHHPDKKGDENKFKKVQMAFEVLKDPEKRQIYDKYGEEGLRDQMGSSSSGSIFDLFNMKSRGPRKTKDSVCELKVTLEEIYNQSSRKLKVTKDAICESCEGKGTKSGRVSGCYKCKGTGYVVNIRRMGANMFSQEQRPCGACRGTGEDVPESDRCPKCQGQKIKEISKVVDVLIEKGVETGHKITFEGYSDEKPGVLPGDLVVVLKEVPHKRFRRKGMNLFIKKVLNLTEALCGTEFLVEHLDKRVLKISTEGSVISPKDLRCIENEGMPLHSRPFVKGGLFISFDVTFPKEGSLSPQDKEALKKLFGPTKCIPASKKCQKVELTKKTLQRLEEEQKVYRTEEEEEDDEHMGGPQVCHTQ